MNQPEQPQHLESQRPIQAAPPQPIKDGDDLDQIMQEVGTQLKKDDRHAPKHHFFSKKKSAPHHKPVPAPLAAHPADNAGPAPQPAAQAPPRPKDKSSTPVLVITVTIIVTGILIAAAISASK